jgi:hypothetical protein
MRLKATLAAVLPVLLLLTAPAARACSNLDFGPVGSNTGAPGDTLTLGISGLTPGATYSISVAGQTYSGGTAGYSATISIQMPPRTGTASEVEVSGQVTHADIEDADGTLSLRTIYLHYPAEPAASPQPATTGAQTSAGGAATAQAQPGAGAAPQQEARPPHRGSRSAHSLTSSRVGRRLVRDRAQTVRAAGAAVPVSQAEPALSRGVTAPVRSTGTKRHGTARRAHRHGRTAPPARLAPVEHFQAPQPRIAAPARARPTGSPIALSLALVIAGTLIVAAATACLLVRWRRSGPDPDRSPVIRPPVSYPPAHAAPDDLEAELQEIIVEQKLRAERAAHVAPREPV